MRNVFLLYLQRVDSLLLQKHAHTHTHTHAIPLGWQRGTKVSKGLHLAGSWVQL